MESAVREVRDWVSCRSPRSICIGAAAFLALVLIISGYRAFPIVLCLGCLFTGWQIGSWLCLSANGAILDRLLPGNDVKQVNPVPSTREQREMPWENLFLPAQLNYTLESFLEQIIEFYVNDWYATGISQDRAFLQEIRYQLRFTCARLWLRLRVVDISRLLSDNALPAAALHVHKVCRLEEKLETKTMPLSLTESNICKQFGGLHRVLDSRMDELNYLRQVSDCIIRRLLDDTKLAGRAYDDDSPVRHVTDNDSPLRVWPSHSVRHFLRELVVNAVLLPGLDLIAHPDTINQLLISAFDLTPNPYTPTPQSPNVPFLQGLTESAPDNAPDSLLQLKLSEILRDARHYSMFRLFLQDIRGPVNELIFLAETHRIHESMQKKDESRSQIEYDIWQLFGQFIHESSAERISLDREIVVEFEEAMESKDIEQLDRVIEKVYQIVYQRMQSEHVISFCQSDSFLGYLCGSPPVSVTELIEQRTLNRPNVTEKSFSFAQFRTKLRRALTLSGSDVETTVDAEELSEQFELIPHPSRDESFREETIQNPTGTFHSSSSPHLSTLNGPCIDVLLTEDEAKSEGDCGTASVNSADVSACPTPEPPPELVVDLEGKNVNCWRVHVNNVEPIRDHVTGRTVFVYMIDVDRMEAKEHETKKWTIYRRYQEFYVLESKLMEFHGESLRSAPLPSRKLLVPKTRVFVEQHRLVFDAFLSGLCKQKLLARSDLLFTFLTSGEEFRDNVLLSDLNPWKVVKQMPGRLSREKGQHLRPFVLGLLASSLAPSKTVASTEKVDISDSSSVNSMNVVTEPAISWLYSSVFGNNCATCKGSDRSDGSRQQWTSSPFDSFLLLFCTIFTCTADWVHSTLSCIRLLAQHSLDKAVRFLVGRGLAATLVEQRLCFWVTFLQQSLFASDWMPPTEQEKILRMELATRRTQEFVREELPQWLVRLLGHGDSRAAAARLVHVLQYPRLNKHLSYVLLDILVTNVFPEDFKEVQ